MELGRIGRGSSLEVFSTMTVPRAVIRNVIPAIIAMLMVLTYNLADTFFIAQTHDALLVAAVSLVTPVFLLFLSVGTIFGVGGMSVISRALGEQRMAFAKKVSAFCTWSSIATGMLMAGTILIFMDDILAAIGASQAIWEPAKTYLTIVVLSGPFVLAAECHSNIIRAEGRSTQAMTGMFLGNAINIILDPIMILWFNWGIAGAAIATVIGNLFGATYYIVYFLRGSSLLSIRPKDFAIRGRIWSSVLAIGIPSSLGPLMMSASLIIMNSLMVDYGDMSLAGIGVAMKVTMMAAMICIGLGQGVQPLLGYCVGAKSWDRFRAIMTYSLMLSFGISAVLTILCYVFSPQIVSAFLTDERAFDSGLLFSRILLTTSALFGVFYVMIGALQAMGAATASLIINLSRQGLFYIPILYIMNHFFGAAGLAIAQPIVDIVSLGLAIMLFSIAYRKRKGHNKTSNRQACSPTA